MRRLARQLDADDDVLLGLRAPLKQLPYRLLYDARGAVLFEKITSIDEYYLTRAETSLLSRHLPRIANVVGARARVIEPGSGAGRKTRMLLAALDEPATYTPIDVAAEQLDETVEALRGEFPSLEVLPLLGDYMRPLVAPRSSRPHGKTLVFFPGSTIGNFEPDAARRFLEQMGSLAGNGAMLLLGADSNAREDELLRAYDDREGVTAAFNLNVLAHVNADYDATFKLDSFMHRAVWNDRRSRIEMHLVSRVDQRVLVAGEAIQFRRGESIVTEHCYKHSPEVIASILDGSGWRRLESFVDDEHRMRLWLTTRG